MCLLNRLVVAIKSNLRLARLQRVSLDPVALLFGVLTTILTLLFHRKQQQGCSYVERAKGEIADKLSTFPLSKSAPIWGLIVGRGISA